MKVVSILLLMSLPVAADVLVTANFDVKKGSCTITDIQDGDISSRGFGDTPVTFHIEGSKPQIFVEYVNIQPVTKLTQEDLTLSFNLGSDKSVQEMKSSGASFDLKENKDNEVLIQSRISGESGIVELYFDVRCD
ncbi:hypothetical protein [Vibrio astriarenae]|uniref:hypothetical protein n=1 Tax=Vibrio astriarenae TaxID=1481923 RepID=UPI003736AF25